MSEPWGKLLRFATFFGYEPRSDEFFAIHITEMSGNGLTTDAFGYAGGAVLATCAIPQVMTMWRNKSARDVSLIYASMYFVGLSLMLVYLILLGGFAGIITISIEVALSALILGSKLLLDRRDNHKVEEAALKD